SADSKDALSIDRSGREDGSRTRLAHPNQDIRHPILDRVARVDEGGSSLDLSQAPDHPTVPLSHLHESGETSLHCRQTGRWPLLGDQPMTADGFLRVELPSAVNPRFEPSAWPISSMTTVIQPRRRARASASLPDFWSFSA